MRSQASTMSLAAFDATRREEKIVKIKEDE